MRTHGSRAQLFRHAARGLEQPPEIIEITLDEERYTDSTGTHFPKGELNFGRVSYEGRKSGGAIVSSMQRAFNRGYMETSQGYTILVATVVLALCTSALMLLRIGARRRDIEDRFAEPAEQAAKDFMQQVNLLRKEREVLDAHLNDYFQTFHESGWPNLLKLLLRLGQAEAQLKQMLEEERYEDALQFANGLLGRVTQEEAQIVQLKFASISGVAGWKREADKIIAKVLESLETAAIETEGVGVSRRRKRQSTFLALHVIRYIALREEKK